MPAGSLVVRTDQPLGRLVFYLLEPESNDGLTTWNVLDEALDGRGQRIQSSRARHSWSAGLSAGSEIFRHELFDEWGQGLVCGLAIDTFCIGTQSNPHDFEWQRALVNVDEVALATIEPDHVRCRNCTLRRARHGRVGRKSFRAEPITIVGISSARSAPSVNPGPTAGLSTTIALKRRGTPPAAASFARHRQPDTGQP